MKFFEKSGLNPRVLAEVRTVKNFVRSSLIPPATSDMGYCGYRKPGAVDAACVQYRTPPDRTGTSGQPPAAGACLDSYVYAALFLSPSFTTRASHMLTSSPAGPLPRFEGVTIAYPQSAPPPAASTPPPPHIPQAPPGPVRVPQLTEADCKKFSELFQVSGASDGVLSGGGFPCEL